MLLFGNVYLYVFWNVLKMKETVHHFVVSIFSSSQWCVTVFNLWTSGRLIVFIIILMAPQACKWRILHPHFFFFPFGIVGIHANHFMFVNIQLCSVGKLSNFISMCILNSGIIHRQEEVIRTSREGSTVITGALSNCHQSKITKRKELSLCTLCP